MCINRIALPCAGSIGAKIFNLIKLKHPHTYNKRKILQAIIADPIVMLCAFPSQKLIGADSAFLVLQLKHYINRIDVQYMQYYMNG